MRSSGRRVLLAIVLALSTGCRATWGPERGRPQFEPRRELWEVPVGLVTLPVAFALDVTTSLALSAGALLVGAVFGSLALVAVRPFTTASLTLVNPDCNLSWNWPPPCVLAGVFGVGLDDEDDDDDPEESDAERLLRAHPHPQLAVPRRERPRSPTPPPIAPAAPPPPPRFRGEAR